MIRSRVYRFVPNPLLSWARRLRGAYRRRSLARLPALSEEGLRSILVDGMNIRTGQVVFVHSSLDAMQLAFPFFRMLPLLREVVGENGTLVFPTFPHRPAIDFLRSGEAFDVRKTPSGMGALTELARRSRDAVRSLHPTKSVSAIGPLAEELTGTHQDSAYPFGECSPFFKLVAHDAKVIGLGVNTCKLSFLHSVDDALHDEFPVRVYHDELFRATCINAAGEQIFVEARAHDLDLMKATGGIVRFMRRHVDPAVCRDMTIGGVPFFVAEARPLFERMVELARAGVTIYPKRFHAEGATGHETGAGLQQRLGTLRRRFGRLLRDAA